MRNIAGQCKIGFEFKQPCSLAQPCKHGNKLARYKYSPYVMQQCTVNVSLRTCYPEPSTLLRTWQEVSNLHKKWQKPLTESSRYKRVFISGRAAGAGKVKDHNVPLPTGARDTGEAPACSYDYLASLHLGAWIQRPDKLKYFQTYCIVQTLSHTRITILLLPLRGFRLVIDGWWRVYQVMQNQYVTLLLPPPFLLLCQGIQ